MQYEFGKNLNIATIPESKETEVIVSSEQCKELELGILTRSFVYDFEDKPDKVMLRQNLLTYLVEELEKLGRTLKDITRVRNRNIETTTWFTVEDLKDLLDKDYYFVTNPGEYSWIDKKEAGNYLIGDDPLLYDKKDDSKINSISPYLIFEMEDGFLDFAAYEVYDYDGGHTSLILRTTLLSKLPSIK